MSQQDLLVHAVRTLEAAGVPYMITGSTASSIQGNPRTTHDIDIVVDLSPEAVPALLGAFPPPRFYADEDAIRNAIATRFMFNILDGDTGDKLNFWILKPGDFDRTAFNRRYRETTLGIQLALPQPEDTILRKLRWAQECGGSEKQMADCIGVYEVNYTNLDFDYLRRWAGHLGVSELLQQVQSAAQP